MSKKSRPRFYLLRRLQRKAKRERGHVVSNFTLTTPDGRVIKLGRGILKSFAPKIERGTL